MAWRANFRFDAWLVMTLRCSFDVVSYYFVTWICLKTGSTPHLWPATSRENGWLNPQLNLSQTKPHPPDVTPDGDAKIAEDSESISRLTCNILQPEDGGGPIAWPMRSPYRSKPWLWKLWGNPKTWWFIRVYKNCPVTLPYPPLLHQLIFICGL